MKNITLLITLISFVFSTNTNAQIIYKTDNTFRHYIEPSDISNFEIYNIGHKGHNYEKMQNFSEGFILIFIYDIGKFAYMDSRAYVIVPKQYDTFGAFSNGRARVQYRGKWGYINPKMQEIIPLQYEEASVFKDGQATVKLKGREKTIDLSGNRVSVVK